MLHNFLADFRGIHFEAATCEPFSLGASDKWSQLCEDVAPVTCFTSGPPLFSGSNTSPLLSPASSYLLASFSYSACIINSVLTGSYRVLQFIYLSTD